ncbi:MAG: hypothetical protein RI907_361 [Pseudomonadota bacterium]|jgi:hypothetical protein
MSAFYDYVRGRTDVVPEGHTEAGMRLYRHLVYLGASQTVDAHFPELKTQLGDEAWRTLIEAFVRESQWASPYLGDLAHDFRDFLARAAEGP